MRRVLVLVAAAFLALAAPSCLLVAPASAHARLLGTSPAAGALVEQVSTVALRFDEPVAVRPGSVRVTGPTGRDVGLGPARTAGPVVRVPVHARTAGTYVVSWRVVSDDGHPEAGSFTFSVRRSTGPAVRPVPSGTSLPAAYAVVRWFGYAGLCALAGGAVFVLLCWPGAGGLRFVRLVTAGGAVLAWLATWAALLVQGAYDDGTWSHLVAPGTVLATLESRTGAATMARLVLLLVLAATLVLTLRWGALLRPGARRRLVAGVLVLTVLTAGTWSASGHASVGAGRPVALVADAVHLAAVAVWLGGLLLLVAVRRPPLGAVRRFSRSALPCVLLVAGTGVYQAQRNLPAWSSLVDSGYGRLVLAKVAGLLVLAGCGYAARRLLVRPSGGCSPDVATTPARLHTLVAVEVVVAAAVLGVAAVLVQTPPR